MVGVLEVNTKVKLEVEPHTEANETKLSGLRIHHVDCQTDDVVIRTQYESGQHLLKCSCKLELLLSASDEVIIVKTSIDGQTRLLSGVSKQTVTVSCGTKE